MTAGVYLIRDPRDGEVKYIGISKDIDARWKTHRYDCHNNGLRDWIRSIRKLGLQPTLDIVVRTEDMSEAKRIESGLIAVFDGRIFNRSGTQEYAELLRTGGHHDSRQGAPTRPIEPIELIKPIIADTSNIAEQGVTDIQEIERILAITFQEFAKT